MMHPDPSLTPEPTPAVPGYLKGGAWLSAIAGAPLVLLIGYAALSDGLGMGAATFIGVAIIGFGILQVILLALFIGQRTYRRPHRGVVWICLFAPLIVCALLLAATRLPGAS